MWALVVVALLAYVIGLRVLRRSRNDESKWLCVALWAIFVAMWVALSIATSAARISVSLLCRVAPHFPQLRHGPRCSPDQGLSFGAVEVCGFVRARSRTRHYGADSGDSEVSVATPTRRSRWNGNEITWHSVRWREEETRFQMNYISSRRSLGTWHGRRMGRARGRPHFGRV